MIRCLQTKADRGGVGCRRTLSGRKFSGIPQMVRNGNGRYRDDVREYLKGDFGQQEQRFRRIAGSPDIYDTRIRGKHASVNFPDLP